MSNLRFGIVGVGAMGKGHFDYFTTDGSKPYTLTAICDINPEKQELAKSKNVTFFKDYQKMIDSGLIDAILIATPHYWHAPIAIAAARKGLHVLCEKPLCSTVGPARQMVDECAKAGRFLGVVLHHRTMAVNRKAKEIIDSGTLGDIFRVQMICSAWWRSQAYYNNGAWRGTWDGEGGGILINQAPHSLDQFQWLGGMPKRVQAVIQTRLHQIEVEDTANIVCEYEGSKIGYIYATTAEQPGYEQIIISGDKATLVIEGGKLRLGKLPVAISEFEKTNTEMWGSQKTEWQDVVIEGDGGGRHEMVTANFTDHILNGAPYIYATGADAMNELQISNAAYISGYKGNKRVEMPVDPKEIESLITKLTRERSTGRGGNLRGAAARAMKKLMK